MPKVRVKKKIKKDKPLSKEDILKILNKKSNKSKVDEDKK